MAKGRYMGGSMPNMQNMLKQAQKMQSEMLKMQSELETKTVEATAGGGAVKVVASGKKEISEIKIDKSVVDSDDIEMLEDLVLVAVNEALKKAEDLQAGQMSKITGGFNIPGL